MSTPVSSSTPISHYSTFLPGPSVIISLGTEGGCPRRRGGHLTSSLGAVHACSPTTLSFHLTSHGRFPVYLSALFSSAFSHSADGIRILPYDQLIGSQNFSRSGTYLRAVVVPVIASCCLPDDDPQRGSSPWQYSVCYVNIVRKHILYVSPAVHDQGCVRAIQASC